MKNKKLQEDEAPTINTTSVGNSSTLGGDANVPQYMGLARRVSDYKKGKKRTSKVDIHTHDVYIDEDGNGFTSKDEGHFHDIKKGVIQFSDMHLHTF